MGKGGLLMITLLISTLTQSVLGMVPKPPVFTTKTEGIAVTLRNGGQIKGHTDVARSGRLFYGFAGIPYGKSPVGELRFEPPVSVDKWEGVKNVFDYGESCPQVDRLTKNLKGTEDCLFLNVFSPKKNTSSGFSEDPLPVLVFIHGGEYSFGSSNAYEPHYFMDHDLVFVSLNYRLASLGFLNTEDGLARGNMGLKDQVLALSWIQENIHLFGGDAQKVTLMGESSGAGSVQYHLLSPMSKGLFRRAISMSGTAVSPYAVQASPLAYAKRFGNLVNCPVENTSLLMSCLRTLDVDVIMKAHFEDRRGILREPMATFSPSIEATHEGAPDTFLSEHPYAVLNSGRQSPVPWLAGVNSEEGLMISARILNDKAEIAKINKYWSDLAPKYLRYDPTRTDITEFINRFYFNSSTIDFRSQFVNFTNLFSDRYALFPLHDAVRIQSKYSRPTYLYFNNYQGKVSFTDIIAAQKNFPVFAVKKIGDLFKEKLGIPQTKALGVCQLDELPLFFKIDPIAVEKTHDDFEESVALVKLWAQFVTEESPELSLSGASWVSAANSNGTLNYMKFTNKNRGAQGMVDEASILEERMKFWDELKINTYGY